MKFPIFPRKEPFLPLDVCEGVREEVRELRRVVRLKIEDASAAEAGLGYFRLEF